MRSTSQGYRDEWPVRIRGREWVIVRRPDVRDDEEELYDPVSVANLLQTSATDAFTHRTVLELCADLWDDDRTPRHRWPDVCSRIEEEFRRRRLAIVLPGSRRDTAGSSAAGPPAAVEDRAADDRPLDKSGGGDSKRKKLTWVALRLIDADKLPVVNERYRVVLPDGSTIEGATDSAGEAWLEEVIPGSCRISFPNLDAREWSA